MRIGKKPTTHKKINVVNCWQCCSLSTPVGPTTSISDVIYAFSEFFCFLDYWSLLRWILLDLMLPHPQPPISTHTHTQWNLGLWVIQDMSCLIVDFLHWLLCRNLGYKLAPDTLLLFGAVTPGICWVQFTFSLSLSLSTHIHVQAYTQPKLYFSHSVSASLFIDIVRVHCIFFISVIC